MTSFQPAKQKLTIASIDDNTTVEAQYNPKDVEIGMSVAWRKTDQANQASPANGGIDLSFTGAEGRSMTVELLFDGFEKEGKTPSGRTVMELIKMLEKMASVRDATSSDLKFLRPHYCVVSWGDRGIPKLECVIERLTTKYTMFSPEGVPLRASCTVALKEAKRPMTESGPPPAKLKPSETV